MSSRRDTWNSEHYKKNPAFLRHDWALGVFEDIKLNGNEIILDIGCGDGNITAKVAQKVPNGSVIGIDLSPSMIRAAKASFAHVANLSFELADATSFSFKQKFDYVTSFFVLHWIGDQLAVLRNIKNALKPKGKVIIIMAAVQEDSPISRAFENLERGGTWDVAIKNNKKRHFAKTAKDFEQLLHQAGFEHKAIEVVYRTSTSNTLETTVQTLMRWVPHSTELPYDQALEFSRALAGDMYKQLNKEAYEPISFSQAFLVIEAQMEGIRDGN